MSKFMPEGMFELRVGETINEQFEEFHLDKEQRNINTLTHTAIITC